jgi:hypothetical protein
MHGGIEQLMNLVESISPKAVDDVILASRRCLHDNEGAASTAIDSGAVQLMVGFLRRV